MRSADRARRPGAAMAGRARAGLVGGFVFLDDRSGNATALAYLVPALARPGPDFRAALPARPAARPAAAAAGAARSADPARVLGIRPEGVLELLGVCRAHVDLVGGAVKAERNRLVPLDLASVGQVAHDRHHSLLSHPAAFPLGKPFGS